MKIKIIDTRPHGLIDRLKRLSTIAIALAILFGPGAYFNSPAMQWAGFIVLLFLCIFFLIVLIYYEGLTIEQARKKLDELEAQQRDGKNDQ